MELVEIALNDTYNVDKLPLLETIVYNNRFTIKDVEATKEAKDAIITLINSIMELKWTENTKVSDSLNIMIIIDNFKKCMI